MHPSEHTVISRKLGAAIRNRRIMAGLSQEALGKAVGISFQQIQKYERGVNQVHFPMMVKLAAAMHMGVAELVIAALGNMALDKGSVSNRAAMELVKRFGQLKPNAQQGIVQLVCKLAEDTA
jgi:transcriptional regulator with XRE-family HTH domain